MPHHFDVRVTVTLALPGCDPIEVERWVKVPADSTTQPLLVALPAYVSRRQPTTLQVNGKPRKVPAAVAILLERLKAGKARAKPATLRKLAQLIPEADGLVTRDENAKSAGGMVPVLAVRRFVG